MPKKKRKIPLPGKRWWTVEFLTREGAPHPAHHFHNFTSHYDTLKQLAKDISGIMLSRSKGAYVAAIWPGQVGEWEALKSDLKPSLHIFGDGFVQRIS